MSTGESFGERLAASYLQNQRLSQPEDLVPLLAVATEPPVITPIELAGYDEKKAEFILAATGLETKFDDLFNRWDGDLATNARKADRASTTFSESPISLANLPNDKRTGLSRSIVAVGAMHSSGVQRLIDLRVTTGPHELGLTRVQVRPRSRLPDNVASEKYMNQQLAKATVHLWLVDRLLDEVAQAAEAQNPEKFAALKSEAREMLGPTEYALARA